MAGRIRSLKPEMNEDSVIADLTDAEHRLWTSAIVIADDHGNFRADPDFLLAQVFWKRRPTDSIDTIVAGLVKAGLWIVYEHRGQRYAHINGWQRHQRIDNAGEPRLPLPPGWTAKCEPRQEGSRSRSRWVAEPPTDSSKSTESTLVPHHHLLGRNGAAPVPTTPAAPLPTSTTPVPPDLRPSTIDQRPSTDEPPHQPQQDVGRSLTKSDVEVRAIADALRLVPEVVDRSGGPEALAKHLHAAIPAPRPGVDPALCARMACVQIQGEAIGTGSKIRPVGSLANLVRTAFVRLYANPSQLAIAVGESKFAKDDPDEPKSVLEAEEQLRARDRARRPARGGEPTPISIGMLGLPPTGTGGAT